MSSPKFEFNESSHAYYLDGVQIPSVTSILPYNYPDGLDYQKTRGTYVHKAIAMHMQDELDEESLDPVIVPYFESYRKIDLSLSMSQIWDFKTGCPHPCTGLQLAGYSLLTREGLTADGGKASELTAGKYNEITLYHPIYRYAGTIDFWYKNTLGDFMQGLFAIHLSPDGTMPKIIDYTKHYRRNVQVFLSYLTIKKWEKENKI